MGYYYTITFYARKIGGAVLYESNLLIDNYDIACRIAHNVCKKHKCFFSIKEYRHI